MITAEDLNDAPQAVREMLYDALLCWRLRFTGEFTVHFNDGIPGVKKQTETKRYGVKAKAVLDRR